MVSVRSGGGAGTTRRTDPRLIRKWWPDRREVNRGLLVVGLGLCGRGRSGLMAAVGAVGDDW